MVTIYTEHKRSRYVEATFRGNHTNIAYSSCSNFYIYFAPVVMVTICTKQRKSRNWEATFRGNKEIIGYPSCIGYYIY